MDMRVLIASDGANAPAIWVDDFAAAGANVQLHMDGDAAIADLEAVEPDVVLLDRGLPGPRSSNDVCREIRARSAVIIIVVAREPDWTDECVALAVGADHYLPATTPVHVVLANIAALLRRHRGELIPGNGLAVLAGPWERPQDTLSGRLCDGDLEIDLDAREVRVAGHDLTLTRTEYELLVLLARRPRQVLTHDQLLSEVRGDLLDSHHLLHTHLSRLRAKVLEVGGSRIPHAVRGVGYRLRP
jgi:DNA-binding response OmpR family regulator